MIQLCRAEYKKIIGNRLLMGCIVWTWPLLICAITSVLTLAFTVDASAAESYQNNPVPWDEAALIPWFLLNNLLGRLLIMGLVVTVFAGEYEHRTWKTIIPGNPRYKLMVAKYLTMGGFIVGVFIRLSILTIVTVGIMNVLIGADYPPTLTLSNLIDFAGYFSINVLMAFIATLLIGGIGILVSIMTRSILMGVLAGLFVSVLEFLGIPLLLSLAAAILNQDWLLDLVAFTPSYNTDNVLAWVNENRSTEYISPDIAALSLIESSIMLIVWIIVLVGLSIAVFQHQDIQ